MKIRLLLLAGLYWVLVEKCAALQKGTSLSTSLAGCLRGLKNLQRFWPYLMAITSCISTGKLE